MSPELGDDDPVEEITIEGIEYGEDDALAASLPEDEVVPTSLRENEVMPTSVREEEVIPTSLQEDEVMHTTYSPAPVVTVEDDTKDEDVVEIPRSNARQQSTPIDVDSPSQSAMQEDFRQLSLSDQEKDYNYKNDPSIDKQTKRALDAALGETTKRYTRRDATILRDEPINVENEPETITSALRKKVHSSFKEDPPTPPSRRVSGKVIPVNAYLLLL